MPDDTVAHGEALGDPRDVTGRIELHDYDPGWPEAYRRQAACVGRALAARALRIEHVGSTSVAGLAAKPIIDIALEVPDSSDESAYAADLEAAGYTLRIREPGWFEHRLFTRPAPAVNLHVFSHGCSEFDRMVRFRDWLRVSDADRDLYGAAKRELAGREWTDVQQYADAKTDVITEILTRADAPAAG
jgi:GrpB-like predicted nucleotidyltransferase (UPF0157 family)